MKQLMTAFFCILFTFSFTVYPCADTDDLEFTRLTVEADEGDKEQDTGDDIWELIADGSLHLTVTAHFTDRTTEELVELSPEDCDIYPDTVIAGRNTYTVYYRDKDSGVRRHASFRLTGVGTAREEFTLNPSNGKWYMQASDGSFYIDTWKMVNGSWYLFDANGYLVSGWYQRNGKWYYLNEDNYRLITGWYTENGIRYYLDPSARGAMCTGWAKINDIWYRFKENGSFASGWILDNNKWYYIEQDGIMKCGWLKDNYTWYYLTPGSGEAAVGWKMIDGKWYYFAPNGAMVVNTVIDGYYLNNDGVWVQNQ